MESVYPYLPAKLGTWEYPYPPLLTLPNTWTQRQTFKQPTTIEGTLTISNTAIIINANPIGNTSFLRSPSNTPWATSYGGTGTHQFSVNGEFVNLIDNITLGALPVQSAPTIVSGTVYQNTTNSYQTLVIPVYATTAGTAGSVAIALGTSSTPAAWGTQYVSGNTSSTACTLINLRVPPQWYYSVTVTDATIGTPAGIQE